MALSNQSVKDNIAENNKVNIYDVENKSVTNNVVENTQVNIYDVENKSVTNNIAENIQVNMYEVGYGLVKSDTSKIYNVEEEQSENNMPSIYESGNDEFVSDFENLNIHVSSSEERSSPERQEIIKKILLK